MNISQFIPPLKANKLSSMADIEKEKLITFLDDTENKFSRQWSANEKFKNLRSSINILKKCIYEQVKITSEKNCTNFIKKCKQFLDNYNVSRYENISYGIIIYLCMEVNKFCVNEFSGEHVI